MSRLTSGLVPLSKSANKREDDDNVDDDLDMDMLLDDLISPSTAPKRSAFSPKLRAPAAADHDFDDDSPAPSPEKKPYSSSRWDPGDGTTPQESTSSSTTTVKRTTAPVVSVPEKKPTKVVDDDDLFGVEDFDLNDDILGDILGTTKKKAPAVSKVDATAPSLSKTTEIPSKETHIETTKRPQTAPSVMEETHPVDAGTESVEVGGFVPSFFDSGRQRQRRYYLDSSHVYMTD